MNSLSAIYDKLPTMECKGLCDNYCGPVGVSPRELTAMRRASKKRLRTVTLESGGVMLKPVKRLRCQCLRKGRCSIYKDRPLLCRIFGMAEGLLCPHGCQPSRVLSHVEVSALLDQIMGPAKPSAEPRVT